MRLRDRSDIERIERVPLAERLDGLDSIWDVIDRAARRWPDQVALRMLSDQPETRGDVVQEMRYAALRDAVVHVGEQLIARGIGRSDVVSFLLPNLVETHVVLWAAETVAVANPINWMLDAEHIADILTAADTQLLVLPPRDSAPDIQRKADALRAKLPALRIVRLGTEEDAVAADDVIVATPGPRSAFTGLTRPKGSDIASYFHTGGTTASPKLAPHTHSNEVYTGWATKLVADFKPTDVVACGLPLFHVNAAIVTGMAAFQAGATVLLLGPNGYRDKAMLAMFWSLVERERISFFSGVPTIYSALLEIDTGGHDLSSLRYAICGAAPMPPELIRRFEAKTGLSILEGYGLTEGTCVSAINPRDGDRKPGSIGLRLPYQAMKTAILDEAGRHVRDCAADETGAILIRGPNVFPGYKADRDNARLWADTGWLNTGDLGRQSDDGYFWLTGRTKELIIRGGHNIDPASIEQALFNHPAVAAVAAVGQLDAYAGEVPVAYVVLKAGTTPPDDLDSFARAHIGERAAVPVRIAILDALPTTAVGKIFKPRLVWMAAEHALRTALEGLIEPGDTIAVDVGPDDKAGRRAEIAIRLAQGGRRDTVHDAAMRILSGFAIAHRLDVTEETAGAR